SGCVQQTNALTDFVTRDRFFRIAIKPGRVIGPAGIASLVSSGRGPEAALREDGPDTLHRCQAKEGPMILPAARSHELTIQELRDETLVFDHISMKAHCLNQTARQVWKLCDGQTSLAEAARCLELPEVAIGLALEQLERRRLLQGPVVPIA